MTTGEFAISGSPMSASIASASTPAAYFRDRGVDAFYPEVAITFEVVDAAAHHHVPLLLSPFAFSTYRGS